MTQQVQFPHTITVYVNPKNRLKTPLERQGIAAAKKHKTILQKIEFSQEIIENNLHVTETPIRRPSTVSVAQNVSDTPISRFVFGTKPGQVKIY